MNVLIIPEDFRKDRYVLKPIIQAMLAELGKPRARVEVCVDPLLGGIRQALDPRRITAIIEQYRWYVHLFLLCVDRDGEPGRQMQLNRVEQAANDVLGEGKRVLATNAWQEVEVWVLAGHNLPNEWSWAEIRSDIDPKERFFEPFAVSREVQDDLEGGRKILAEEAARRYPRIRQRCPEDVAVLENRIRAWLNG